MIITHCSPTPFSQFDVSKYSKFGDYGEGVYFFLGDYCAYALHIDNLVYRVDGSLLKTITVNDCNPANNYWKYEQEIDAVIISNQFLKNPIVVVKKLGVAKLSIISVEKIMEIHI